VSKCTDLGGSSHFTYQRVLIVKKLQRWVELRPFNMTVDPKVVVCSPSRPADKSIVFPRYLLLWLLFLPSSEHGSLHYYVVFGTSTHSVSSFGMVILLKGLPGPITALTCIHHARISRLCQTIPLMYRLMWPYNASTCGSSLALVLCVWCLLFPNVPRD
jgi:hypothetical protein